MQGRQWGFEAKQKINTNDPDPGLQFCLALKELEKYWDLNTFFKAEKRARG